MKRSLLFKSFNLDFCFNIIVIPIVYFAKMFSFVKKSSRCFSRICIWLYHLVNIYKPNFNPIIYVCIFFIFYCPNNRFFSFAIFDWYILLHYTFLLPVLLRLFCSKDICLRLINFFAYVFKRWNTNVHCCMPSWEIAIV